MGEHRRRRALRQDLQAQLHQLYRPRTERSSGGARALTLVLSPRGNSAFDTDQFKLWVGTQEFLFSDATNPNQFFVWNGAGLGWEVGTQTTVRLVRNRRPTGAVAITGTARHGQTLTAGTGTIADQNGLIGARFEYQWVPLRDIPAML